MLTRDQILKADDLKKEEVSVPEWGGSVYIREISAGERLRFEAIHNKDPQKNFFSRVAIACVCDENGNALFNEGDIELLEEKSLPVLTRIYKVFEKINKTGMEEYEEVGKDSKGSPSDSSPTGSL